MSEEPSKEAVRVAELFADGLASTRQLTKARTAASKAELKVWNELEEGNFKRVVYDDFDAAVAAEQLAFEDLFEHDPSVNNTHLGGVVYASHSAMTRSFLDDADTGHRQQIALVHDVFGNPFRPITLNQQWLTPTVTKLATAMYKEGAFDRLGILADALEEAGCTNQELLAHCRGAGPHVRGCWVVDLLLSKN